MVDEKKLSIINNNIRNCVKSNSAVIYIYPNIPQNIINGARRKFVPSYEEIIALIDTTVFNSGERGLAFTNNGIYFKDILLKPCGCTYSDYVTSPMVADDVYFNAYSITELATKLFFSDYNDDDDDDYDDDDDDDTNESGTNLATLLGEALGEALGEYIGEKINNKVGEYITNKTNQENDEIIEGLRDTKSQLRELNSTIKTLISSVNYFINNNDNESFDNKYMAIQRLSFFIASFADIDWLNNNFSEEQIEAIDMPAVSTDQIFELFDEIDKLFIDISDPDDNDNNFKIPHLKNSLKILSNTIISTFENMYDEYYEFDSDNIDLADMCNMDNYLSICKRALQEFKSKVQDTMNQFDSLINFLYEMDFDV
ncbi:MAG: hypothetical protein J5994_05135 [Ruminococcus sp.]|nr:hypothetical protein [Ruminococcus sp.]